VKNQGRGASQESFAIIAKEQAEETFESIKNLDNICHTSMVAIAFIISALCVWWTAIGTRINMLPLSREISAALTVACAVCVAFSTSYFVRAIFPRFFFGEIVGSPFVEHPWQPWRADKANLQREFKVRETTAKLSAEEKRKKFLQWIKEYGKGVKTPNDFQLARFFYYKYVAAIKATNTARGIAWMRLAIILVAVLMIVGVFGPIMGTYN
jgi:hypothetical protein